MRTISEIIARLAEVQHEIEEGLAAKASNLTVAAHAQLVGERYELSQELANASYPTPSINMTNVERLHEKALSVDAQTRGHNVVLGSADMEPKAMRQIHEEMLAGEDMSSDFRNAMLRAQAAEVNEISNRGSW